MILVDMWEKEGDALIEITCCNGEKNEEFNMFLILIAALNAEDSVQTRIFKR